MLHQAGSVRAGLSVSWPSAGFPRPFLILTLASASRVWSPFSMPPAYRSPASRADSSTAFIARFRAGGRWKAPASSAKRQRALRRKAGAAPAPRVPGSHRPGRTTPVWTGGKTASDDSGMRARKPELAVEEQIAHLKPKGVTFDLCSEGEAAECPSDRTCHFKLAAYRVLFDKRVGGERDGEYVGLDFGHLRDLAAIDHMLRYTLLPMTLDVEHFAKAELMRGPTERPEEGGYSIVGDYLAGLSKKSLDIRVGEMRRLGNDRCSGGLARWWTPSSAGRCF